MRRAASAQGARLVLAGRCGSYTLFGVPLFTNAERRREVLGGAEERSGAQVCARAEGLRMSVCVEDEMGSSCLHVDLWIHVCVNVCVHWYRRVCACVYACQSLCLSVTPQVAVKVGKAADINREYALLAKVRERVCVCVCVYVCACKRVCACVCRTASTGWAAWAALSCMSTSASMAAPRGYALPVCVVVLVCVRLHVLVRLQRCTCRYAWWLVLTRAHYVCARSGRSPSTSPPSSRSAGKPRWAMCARACVRLCVSVFVYLLCICVGVCMCVCVSESRRAWADVCVSIVCGLL